MMEVRLLIDDLMMMVSNLLSNPLTKILNVDVVRMNVMEDDFVLMVNLNRIEAKNHYFEYYLRDYHDR